MYDIDHKSIDSIYDSKMIKVGQTCGDYPTKQNVIRLLNVCQPQTLFRAIFQNPMEKLHCIFVEGTGRSLLPGFRTRHCGFLSSWHSTPS